MHDRRVPVPSDASRSFGAVPVRVLRVRDSSHDVTGRSLPLSFSLTGCRRIAYDRVASRSKRSGAETEVGSRGRNSRSEESGDRTTLADTRDCQSLPPVEIAYGGWVETTRPALPSLRFISRRVSRSSKARLRPLNALLSTRGGERRSDRRLSGNCSSLLSRLRRSTRAAYSLIPKGSNTLLGFTHRFLPH